MYLWPFTNLIFTDDTASTATPPPTPPPPPIATPLHFKPRIRTGFCLAWDEAIIDFN